MPYDKKNPRHAYAKALASIAAVLCAVAIVCVMRNPSARNVDSVATQPPAAGAVQTLDDATEDQGGSSVVDDDANTMVAFKMADIEAPQPYEYVDEVDSGETGDDAATETSDDERLTIPEGANYVPDEVLVSVSPDATVEEVNALLAQTGSVVPREVSAEEIAEGYITVEVSEGANVEDAMNDLDDSELTEGAQPNFIYYAMLGDERDLRARLAASAIPQPMLRAAAAGEDTESSDATADDVSAAEETAGGEYAILHRNGWGDRGSRGALCRRSDRCRRRCGGAGRCGPRGWGRGLGD